MIVTLTLNPSLDEWVRLPTLRIGALNRAASFERFPGGKGINVSRVVHELGRRTRAVGIAGGYDGHILSRLLEEQRIPHKLVHVRGATRNNYQLQTQTPPVITQVNTPGPKVSAAALRAASRLVCASPKRTDCVVLSGSLPPGAPASIYARILKAVARHQILTVLDSSGAALREGLAGRPWLIKPNRDEAQELLGRALSNEASVVKAVRELTSSASVVIISLGGDGAVLATKEQTLRAWAPKIEVHSTIGAGDSLVAGFVTEWLRTRSLSKALALGIACGSATAMTSGTELCHRKDVLRLVGKVKIRALG